MVQMYNWSDTRWAKSYIGRGGKPYKRPIMLPRVSTRKSVERGETRRPRRNPEEDQDLSETCKRCQVRTLRRSPQRDRKKYLESTALKQPRAFQFRGCSQHHWYPREISQTIASECCWLFYFYWLTDLRMRQKERPENRVKLGCLA